MVGIVMTATPAFAADAIMASRFSRNALPVTATSSDAIGLSLKGGPYSRKSGSLADFRYSNAMMRANLDLG